jgi:3-oxoadipate enol-lactonase/4-carboxymuconolactone decarboxylase
VRYLEGGAGPPVLVLHGNGASAEAERALITSLAASHRVIAWDMPGHGDSGAVGRHLSIDDFADALAELIAQLGASGAAVIGFSIGGHIALSLASRYPQHVRACVLVETMFRTDDQWQKMWPMVEQTFSVVDPGDAALGQRLIRPTRDVIARMRLDRSKTGAHTMMSACWAIREFDMPAAVGRVVAPTLLLYGRSGPALPTLERFDVRPDFTRVILEDCGHFPSQDQPEAFVTAVLPHLRDQRTATLAPED